MGAPSNRIERKDTDVTGELDASTGRRMLSLAAPMPKNRIRCNTKVASALIDGIALEEAHPDMEDFRNRPPIVALRRRTRTLDDAVRLQLVNRALSDRFAKYTPPSRRLGMLGRHTFQDRTGAKAAYISGLVVDFSISKTGRLSRICLLSPSTTDTAGMFPTRPFDSHIWLMADDMDACGDYGDATDDNPTVHGQASDHSGEIHLGEMLCIAARLRAYRDKHGRRRIDVGEWAPLAASCLYLLRHSDGGLSLKHVPSHLMRSMRLVRIGEDGTPDWADPIALAGEVERWERMWPAASTDLRLYS